MTQGIFVRDFISFDHIYLNLYGELTGNSLLPVMNVNGVNSAAILEAQNVALAQMRRYKDKIIVIEGMSNCKVKVVGEEKQWNIRPMTAFDAKMFDQDEPGSLYDYMSKDIEIETSLFKAVMPGSYVKIMKADIVLNNSQNRNYYDYINPTIEKNIETILKVVLSNDTIEVKLDWYQSGAYQTGLAYAYANYVRVYVNDADSIVYGGYAAKIETPRTFNANGISESLNDGLLFNTADMDSSLKEIVKGAYSIKFDFEDHYKKTSRRINVKNFHTVPTIDVIADKFGCSLGDTKSMSISEGLLSGVTRN